MSEENSVQAQPPTTEAPTDSGGGADVHNPTHMSEAGTPEPSPTVDVATLQQQIQALTDEKASTAKQLKDAQSYIGTQSNDIGSLKKMLAQNGAPQAAPADPQSDIDDMVQNPREFALKVMREEAAKEKAQRIEQQERSFMASQAVMRRHPDLEAQTPALIEYARSMGLPNYDAGQLQRDIASNPKVVIQTLHNIKQQAKIASLEAALTSGPQVQKAAAASKTSGVGTSTGGATGQGIPGLDKPMSAMTNEELDIILQGK